MHIVLLPGIDGTGELFRPFTEALPPQFIPQVISYPTSGPQSYDDLVHVVNRALPPTKHFVLLGESFGGPLALKVASQSIPNLRAVVLCATFVLNPLPWSFAWVPFAPRSMFTFIVKRNIPSSVLRLFLTG
jgi:pimeloyl-ACP methyl ester carboxylesterase